jgi:hypothetical protein
VSSGTSGFAHIGWLCAQPDPSLAIQANHPFWLSRSSTPLPRLSTMFHCAVDDVELPISADKSRKLAFSAPQSGVVTDRLIRQSFTPLAEAGISDPMLIAEIADRQTTFVLLVDQMLPLFGRAVLSHRSNLC